MNTDQPSSGLTSTYAYDPQNHRIWSWPGTTDSWGNVSSYTVNIYTPSGQKLAAYTLVPAFYTSPFLAVALSSSDQYFGSRRLAPMDQLGSAGTYFPWGENRGSTNPQDNWSFATCQCGQLSGDQERALHDAISGEGLSYNQIIELAKQMFGCKGGTQGSQGGTSN